MDKALATKLFKVMEATEGVKKDLSVGSGNNSYSAVSEKGVLNMLKPLFREQKLIMIPKDGDMSEDIFTYSGGNYDKLRAVTHLKVFFTIVDTESGESVDVVGFGNGADSQDKGSGKAFTYAYKTCLMKTFMLFSGEDTDNTHSDDIGNIKKPKLTESQKTANWIKNLDDKAELVANAGYDFVTDVLMKCALDTRKEANELDSSERKKYNKMIDDEISNLKVNK